MQPYCSYCLYSSHSLWKLGAIFPTVLLVFLGHLPPLFAKLLQLFGTLFPTHSVYPVYSNLSGVTSKHTFTKQLLIRPNIVSELIEEVTVQWAVSCDMTFAGLLWRMNAVMEENTEIKWLRRSLWIWNCLLLLFHHSLKLKFTFSLHRQKSSLQLCILHCHVFSCARAKQRTLYIYLMYWYNLLIWTLAVHACLG